MGGGGGSELTTSILSDSPAEEGEGERERDSTKYIQHLLAHMYAHRNYHCQEMDTSTCTLYRAVHVHVSLSKATVVCMYYTYRNMYN